MPSSSLVGLANNEDMFLRDIVRYLKSCQFHKGIDIPVDEWLKSFKTEYKGQEFVLGEFVRVAKRITNPDFVVGGVVENNKVFPLVVDFNSFKFKKDFTDEEIENFKIMELVLEEIKLLEPGQMVDLEATRAKVPQIDDSSFKKQLVDCLQWQVLELLYKLNTEEALVDYENNWTKELPSLMKDFHCVNGLIVDGKDFHNIKIGFKKT